MSPWYMNQHFLEVRPGVLGKRLWLTCNIEQVYAVRTHLFPNSIELKQGR